MKKFEVSAQPVSYTHLSYVITNSSTEIYTVCTEYTLDRLKDIVNSILKIADSTLTACLLYTSKINFSNFGTSKYNTIKSSMRNSKSFQTGTVHDNLYT